MDVATCAAVTSSVSSWLAVAVCFWQSSNKRYHRHCSAEHTAMCIAGTWLLGLLFGVAMVMRVWLLCWGLFVVKQ
jgi:hypothetical protein